MRGGPAPSPTPPSPHNRPGTGSWARPFAQRAPQHNQRLRRTPPANARSAHCPAKLKRKRLSNRPGGSIAIFQPPRALPRGTPTYAGMPLGTRGRAHAWNGARARQPQTEPLRNPPGHAHLREHAREDEMARVQGMFRKPTAELQATLTYASMPLRCGRPRRKTNV